MKKLICIILSVCLFLTPINIVAIDSEDNGILTKENITITPSAKTPEELAIEKILAHKRALGEDTSNAIRSQAQGLDDGGVYYIKNYFSGKYLNVHYGVDANGTNVYQWTGDSSTEQKFKIVYHSSTDSYKIYAMCSSNGTNRVLDVVRNGSPLASGQNVDIWTPVDHTAQRMKMTYLTYDIYHIQMNANTNMYLTSYGNSNGTSGGKTATSAGNVFIKTFNVNDNQQWQFIRISSPPVTPPEPEPEPEPEPMTPYGWLDDVTANGIRGWVWCQNYPDLALNVSIKIYDESTVLRKTINLVADQYRQDVAESGLGTGNYGFHTSIDWDEFDSGTYTVRAYAGIGTPTTELHDSQVSYIVVHRAVLVGVVDSNPPHDHLIGVEQTAEIIENGNYYSAQVEYGEFDYTMINDYLDNNNNKIFAIRGHGDVTYSYYGNQTSTYMVLTDVANTENRRYYSNTYMQHEDLSNLELVLFVGCKTGMGGNGANNLPTAAVQQGAIVAIGFDDSIGCGTANQWLKRFFEVANNKTIYEIIVALNSDDSNNFANTTMSMEHTVICGNSNYRLSGF